MLEHFRYGDLFLRKFKNAYISFITPELLRLVTAFKPKIKYLALDTKINRLGFPTRTKQLRKYFATILREHLPTEACMHACFKAESTKVCSFVTTTNHFYKTSKGRR